MSQHIEELKYIMQSLMAESDDIEGLTIVSVQGLPIVSLFNDPDINESLVSAMAAAILSVGQRASEELKRGTMARTLIQSDKGQLILTQAGKSAILVTLVKKDAGLGIIFMLIDSTIKKIAKLLDEE